MKTEKVCATCDKKVFVDEKNDAYDFIGNVANFAHYKSHYCGEVQERTAEGVMNIINTLSEIERQKLIRKISVMK